VHPALHPCGAALRAFKFAPGKFVESWRRVRPLRHLSCIVTVIRRAGYRLQFTLFIPGYCPRPCFHEGAL